MVFAAVLGGVILEYFLFWHRLGIAIRGHGSRPEAARLAGVAPRKTRLIAYTGCSLLSGFAGIVMMGQVGTGDRSERIRTYNYAQSRVTDHRINLTLYKLDDVLGGELDSVIEPLINEYQAEQLASLDS